MARSTATQRQLIRLHKQASGLSSLKDWFDVEDENSSKVATLAFFVLFEALAVVIGGIIAAYNPHKEISIPIVMLSLPTIFVIIMLVTWPIETAHQRKQFRYHYVGCQDSTKPAPNFHELYHEQAISDESRKLQAELAEICGQTTVRYLQLQAEHVDMKSDEIQQWLQGEYNQAKQLAEGIKAYDQQIAKLAEDEQKQAEKVLADQIAGNRRIALDRFRQEQAARAQLRKDGVDPVQQTIDALSENTERIKQLRAEIKQ